MTYKNLSPAEKWKVLYENLFVKRDKEQTFEIISEGLDAFTENAKQLLDKAEHLAKLNWYAIPNFLITTANEEIAKFYIMVDACRLDFDKHKNILKRLCRAFYNHITKYAYTMTVRQHVYDLKHAKDYIELYLTKYFRGDPQSGEPDMPHQTYFGRDFNLYVDYIEYDKEWHIPEMEVPTLSLSDWEEFLFINPIWVSRKALERLLYTCKEKLHTPEVLNILNEIFKKHYITEKTSNEDLNKIYQKVAEKIENELKIPQDKFKKSALLGWPLYHFIS